MRPREKMTAALSAVGAAETGDRHEQMGEGGDEIAFVTVWKYPRTLDRAILGQLVDMPPNCLAPSHMPPQPRLEPARAFR